MGNLYQRVEGGNTVQYIVFGESSVKFTKVGANYVPTKSDGSSLSLTGSTFTYVARDGATYKFDGDPFNYTIGTPCTEMTADRCYLLSSISKPNGQKTTLSWNVVSRCAGFPCTTNKTSSRLLAVENNNGYRMEFTYAQATFTGVNPPLAWAQRTSAVLFNKTLCAPGPANCGGATPSWPTVTYAGTTGVDRVAELTDPAGRKWYFTYGGNNMTGIRRPGAATDNITVNYDGSGLVSSLTKDGVTWTYSRVVVGSTATMTVTDPFSQQVIVTSDLTVGRPTSVRDELSRTTNYTYDGAGRVTDIVYPEGNKLKLTYDARGNITEQRAISKTPGTPADIVETASFDASCANIVKCNLPNSVTDGRGNVTDYTYDSGHGGVLSITLPAATSGGTRPQTRFSYTALEAWYKNSSGTIVASGLPITSLTGISACQTSGSCAGTSDEVKTTTTYGTSGVANNLLPTSVSSGAGDGSLTATNTLAYDIVGNVTTVDGPLAGTADTTRFRYDTARQVTGIVGPDPDGAGTRKPTARRLTYNPDGQITVAETGTVNSQSDADWAGFSAADVVTSTYDGNARKVRDILSSAGTDYAATQFSYDALGRQECSTQRMNPAIYGSLPSSACSLGTAGSFGADRIAKTVYDAAGQIIKVQSAVGTLEQADEVTTGYTNNGRVAYVIDAENNRTGYTYDGHDRQVKTEYPSATKGANSVNTSDYEQLAYDAKGNVTSRRLRDGTTINYGYDNLDRVVSKDLPASDPDVTYSYDLLGRPVGAQNGQTLAFAYDALGRQTSETTNNLGSVSYGYDAAGRRTSMTYPGSALTLNYDYDVVGNVTAIRENGATSGVGVLASYAFDNLGRRTSVTFGNGSAQSFSYDAVSRLATLTNDLNAGTTTHDLTQTFAYNPSSQIASVNRSNDIYAWNGHYNVDRSYVANGLNRLTSAGATSLGYDARGNLTTSGSNSYGYNSENMMTSGPGGTTLGYDPVNRLKWKVGSGVTNWYAYDGANLIEETDPWGARLRRYVHGPGIDNPIVWYEGSAINSTTRRFLMADERGSIVSVTDSSNATIGLNSYDEYGIPASGNIGRFGYTGQLWLPELGMWHYKARVYSPTLGRFMQTDPIGYQDGMNWYDYVSSDPVNKIDPMGLDACTDGSNDICVTAKKKGPPTASKGLGLFWNEISLIGGDKKDKIKKAVNNSPYKADLSSDGCFTPTQVALTPDGDTVGNNPKFDGTRYNTTMNGNETQSLILNYQA